MRAEIIGTDRTDGPPAAPLAVGMQALSVEDLHVPMLPDVVAQVLAATARADSDSRQLAALACRDAGLASHLVRLAGSAMFGTQKVSSLVQAVTRLGTSGLRQAALLVAAQAELFRVPGHAAEVREILRHSCMAGCFAREVSKLRRCNAEEAFLAGLLHDVGKPALLAAFSDPKRRAHLGVAETDVAAAVTEHHARAGGLVATAWRLSPMVVEGVACHHAPESEIAHTVALADALAKWATVDPAEAAEAEAEAAVRGHASLEPLNLYPEDVGALLARREEVLASAGGAAS